MIRSIIFGLIFSVLGVIGGMVITSSTSMKNIALYTIIISVIYIYFCLSRIFPQLLFGKFSREYFKILFLLFFLFQTF